MTGVGPKRRVVVLGSCVMVALVFKTVRFKNQMANGWYQQTSEGFSPQFVWKLFVYIADKSASAGLGALIAWGVERVYIFLIGA